MERRRPPGCLPAWAWSDRVTVTRSGPGQPSPDGIRRGRPPAGRPPAGLGATDSPDGAAGRSLSSLRHRKLNWRAAGLGMRQPSSSCQTRRPGARAPPAAVTVTRPGPELNLGFMKLELARLNWRHLESWQPDIYRHIPSYDHIYSVYDPISHALSYGVIYRVGRVTRLHGLSRCTAVKN
jgi:hypothetical protein